MNVKRNIRKNQRLTTVVALGLGLLAVSATAQYSDSFGGPLNTGFWSTNVQSGYIVCPSSTRAHSGSYSLQLVTTDTGANKSVRVSHQFPTATYGTVSVWMYDTGAGVPSGNYMGLQVNSAGQHLVSVGTYDYGFGDGSTYNYGIGSSPAVAYIGPITRTAAWHKFEIAALPGSLTVSIDGTVVYTGAGGRTFDYVDMYLAGPNWRPAQNVQFDDFQFTPSDQANFSDAFEGATLDPFWATGEQSGQVVFPAATRSHSGSQSVELVTANTGQNKDVRLYHLFAPPSYGTVSVWVYDTGAGVSSANYITFSINSSNSTGIAGVGTYDYDLGPGDGGSTYTYVVPIGSGPSHYTGIERTQAWHQFAICCWSNSLVLKIDGTVVYSGPGREPIGEVHLVLSGPSWRPACTVQLDDFQFVGQAAQPAMDIHMYAGVTVTGTVNAPYQIQYRTDLGSPTWQPLADILLPSSPYIYFDTNSPAAVRRFYRAVLMQ